MKVINCAKCNEEYAIDLNKPEEWYCPYCDNLYSVSTDNLSVEKLQEQLNTAKKALTEITNIPESDNYFDEEERLSCIKEAAEKALAAIGGDDDRE